MGFATAAGRGRATAGGGVGRASLAPSGTITPSFMRMMRWACLATSGSCVTSTMVMPSALPLEHRENLGSGGRVEIAGRLVGQQQRRPVDQPPARSRRAAAVRRTFVSGRGLSRSASCTRASSVSAQSLASMAGMWWGAYSIGMSTLSRALVRAGRLKLWKTKPILRLRTTARASASRPEISPSVSITPRRGAIETTEQIHERGFARP